MTRPDPTNHQAAERAASVFKGANVNNPNVCGCFAICPNCDPLANPKQPASETGVVIPAKCTELVSALLDSGWSFVVQHGKDTGDHPYISIEARRGRQDVRITWHTRATGTYRLFSCMVQKRDVTLTKAMDTVRKPVEAS